MNSTQKSWTPASTMTASQAVAPLLPLKDSYISNCQYVYDTDPRVCCVCLTCIEKIYMSMLESGLADEIVANHGQPT